MYPYCENTIHMDKVFGKVVTLSLNLTHRRWFKCEYSKIIGQHFPYLSLDDALTTNLEKCGNFEEVKFNGN